MLKWVYSSWTIVSQPYVVADPKTNRLVRIFSAFRTRCVGCTPETGGFEELSLPSLREEKEKLSSTRRDLLTDSITDSLKLPGIFIVGRECKLPVGASILAVLIIFKRDGENLNWKFFTVAERKEPSFEQQSAILSGNYNFQSSSSQSVQFSNWWTLCRFFC